MSVLKKRPTISVYLTQELIAALADATARDERTASYVVQQALTFWLAQGAPVDFKPIGRRKRGRPPGGAK